MSDEQEKVEDELQNQEKETANEEQDEIKESGSQSKEEKKSEEENMSDEENKASADASDEDEKRESVESEEVNIAEDGKAEEEKAEEDESEKDNSQEDNSQEDKYEEDMYEEDQYEEETVEKEKFEEDTSEENKSEEEDTSEEEKQEEDKSEEEKQEEDKYEEDNESEAGESVASEQASISKVEIKKSKSDEDRSGDSSERQDDRTEVDSQSIGKDSSQTSKDEESSKESPRVSDDVSESSGKKPTSPSRVHYQDDLSSKQTTPRSRGGRTASDAGSPTRTQMVAELQRLRSQLVRTATSISRPSVKPYTPHIFNDLSPYYNKYVVDSMLEDQDPIYKPWRKYGQRACALKIVEPEKSLMMDSLLVPFTYSRVQAQLWTPKTWSKNLSGKGDDLGSTRLPPLPSVAVVRPQNPKYQHFKMTYDEVPNFRHDMKSAIKGQADKKAKEDFHRVEMDWKRMNLSELKDLPVQSRQHVGKAITTYLGTSRGSFRAVNKLKKEIGAHQSEIGVQ